MRAVALVAVLAGVAGCGSVLGIDDLVADLEPGGVSSGPGGGCAGACGTPGCGECPAVPRVAAPSGGFAIDRQEVTIASYLAWLATDPSLENQRKECDWNDSFSPGVISQQAIDDREASGEGPFEVDEGCATFIEDQPSDDRPIACVDWCDAAAFCAWAGGRLCGAVGGGTIDVSDGPGTHADPGVSEWYQACSNGGERLYPYGNDFAPAACNSDGSGLDPVGSNEACVGGFEQVFDMSGNIAEWEDACAYFNNPDTIQNCVLRGGAWWQTDGLALQCGDPNSYAEFRDVGRSSIGADKGFRCCADL